MKNIFKYKTLKHLLNKFNKKEQAMSMMFPALKSWKKTDGDYLEFGVYRGRAFKAAYDEAIRHKYEEMRFFAFDSFEGLPEVKGEDEKHKHFYKGQYACSESEF